MMIPIECQILTCGYKTKSLTNDSRNFPSTIVFSQLSLQQLTASRIQSSPPTIEQLLQRRSVEFPFFLFAQRPMMNRFSTFRIHMQIKSF
jgi:hypothetical protein